MVRWSKFDADQERRVRASLSEITRLREDLYAVTSVVKGAIEEMYQAQRNLDQARGDGRITESEHVRYLRSHLKAMIHAEDILCRSLYLTRQYNEWPLR